jgi:hypothetical protein
MASSPRTLMKAPSRLACKRLTKMNTRHVLSLRWRGCFSRADIDGLLVLGGAGRGQRFDSPIAQASGSCSAGAWRPGRARDASRKARNVSGDSRSTEAQALAVPGDERLVRYAAGRFDGRISNPLQPPGAFPAEARSRAGAREKHIRFIFSQVIEEKHISRASGAARLPPSGSNRGRNPPFRRDSPARIVKGASADGRHAGNAMILHGLGTANCNGATLRRHAGLLPPPARRPLSRSQAAITAPRSAANPRKPVASEVELAPINSVEPVRLMPI